MTILVSNISIQVHPRVDLSNEKRRMGYDVIHDIFRKNYTTKM